LELIVLNKRERRRELGGEGESSVVEWGHTTILNKWKWVGG
jgi:hypothetical protein